MRETIPGYVVFQNVTTSYTQYKTILNSYYGHLGDYELDKFYDNFLRSLMTKEEKENRDRETHMVDIAQ